MISSLYIKNFTLISELNIQFHPGFSVITGETGAGKSIILGAIGLLLGNRADSKTIKTGCDRCTIEAHFNLSNYHLQPFFDENDIDYDADDCIIRRELTAAGKSRAFINDTPVSLTLMRELGEQLVDIHSQHQNLLLNKEDFQLNVIDIIADDQSLKEEYKSDYQQYRQALAALEQLKSDIARSQENEDFIRFQHNELKSAMLDTLNQEELEQQSYILTHSEEIKSTLYSVHDLLDGEESSLVSRASTACDMLAQLEDMFPQVKELAERLDSCSTELADIASEVNTQFNRIDFDPRQLDSVNEKLDTIYQLQQKYHVNTVDDLLALQASLAKQLEHIDNSSDELLETEARVKDTYDKAAATAARLTKERVAAASRIEKEMLTRLAPLGIPNVRFQVSLESKPLASDGADKVAFLFSANTNTPMQPVSQVASGGEIARVMLSLKAMISGAVKLPTIIFDEIDTGVSGKIAEKMAQIMQEMGNSNRQVISITHLPQIAARGTHHYKVFKEETPNGTTSHMQMLQPKERVTEIAQMLSGEAVSAAALQNARELLKKD